MLARRMFLGRTQTSKRFSPFRKVTEQQPGVHKGMQTLVPDNIAAAKALVATRIEHALIFLQNVDYSPVTYRANDGRCRPP